MPVPVSVYVIRASAFAIGVTNTKIWVADAAQDQDWAPPVSCGSRVLLLTMYVAHLGLFPVLECHKAEVLVSFFALFVIRKGVNRTYQDRYEVNIELQSIDIAPYRIQKLLGSFSSKHVLGAFTQPRRLQQPQAVEKGPRNIQL